VRPAPRSAREPPDQPGVHRAEEELAAVGRVPGPRHVLKDPKELRAREVRRDAKASPLPDERLHPLRGQSLAEVTGACVLPDDRRRDRPSGPLLPHQGGLTLVRNTYGGDSPRRHGPRGERLADDRLGTCPDLERVMLDPAGLGVVLGVLLVGGGMGGPVLPDQHASRAGGTLIDRRNVHWPAHPRRETTPWRENET
jgi:hypothetical protein